MMPYGLPTVSILLPTLRMSAENGTTKSAKSAIRVLGEGLSSSSAIHTCQLLGCVKCGMCQISDIEQVYEY